MHFALIPGQRAAQYEIICSAGQPGNACCHCNCLLPPGRHRLLSFCLCEYPRDTGAILFMGAFAICQCSTVYKYSHFKGATASVTFRRMNWMVEYNHSDEL